MTLMSPLFICHGSDIITCASADHRDKPIEDLPANWQINYGRNLKEVVRKETTEGREEHHSMRIRVSP